MSFLKKITKEVEGRYEEHKFKSKGKALEKGQSQADSSQASWSTQSVIGSPAPSRLDPLGPTLPPLEQPNYYPTYQPDPIPPTPALPHGRLALWEPVGRRWAFLDINTSIVSWTFPDNNSLPAYSTTTGQTHSIEHAPTSLLPNKYVEMTGNEALQKSSKKENKKNIMAGAAAGVAVGVIGGLTAAKILDEDNSSENEYSEEEESSSDNGDNSDDEDSELDEAQDDYVQEYEDGYGSG